MQAAIVISSRRTKISHTYCTVHSNHFVSKVQRPCKKTAIAKQQWKRYFLIIKITITKILQVAVVKSSRRKNISHINCAVHSNDSGSKVQRPCKQQLQSNNWRKKKNLIKNKVKLTKILQVAVVISSRRKNISHINCAVHSNDFGSKVQRPYKKQRLTKTAIAKQQLQTNQTQNLDAWLKGPNSP